MTVDVERQLQVHRAYQDTLRTAGECMHGVVGGEIVRPWTGTPGCALCRCRPPLFWWRLRFDAQP